MTVPFIVWPLDSGICATTRYFIANYLWGAIPEVSTGH